MGFRVGKTRASSAVLVLGLLVVVLIVVVTDSHSPGGGLGHFNDDGRGDSGSYWRKGLCEHSGQQRPLIASENNAILHCIV